MTSIPVKRALISVSDKSGLIPFANKLVAHGVEIISTGGTSKVLSESNVPHLQVEDITELPEMLGGRVKTLHPKIHGGILGKRQEQASEAAQLGIKWIDLVVVNFYPFSEAVAKQAGWDEAVEKIDIGGPTMVRAAAKNFAWVGVVTDPDDYHQVVNELDVTQGLGLNLRKNLAEKAFSMTGQYDAMIYQYFSKGQQKDDTDELPDQWDLTLRKKHALRYGENPHQVAAAYQIDNAASGVLSAKQLQGKALSYNNMLDADAAWQCVQVFEQPACVIVKHANPCGVAVSSDIEIAFQAAYQADSLSAFGGIVALNRPCTREIAQTLSGIFMEIVIAPHFEQEALDIFSAKPDLRLLTLETGQASPYEMKFIEGAVLIQGCDRQIVTEQDLKVVTRVKPSSKAMQDMLFAWQVVRYIKSNAILIAKNNQTVGIGAGQVSRVDAVDIAIKKAGEQIKGSVLASDAFFPFRDSIDKLAATGIEAIIQPGGSKRDEEVIAACDEHDIAMVFTGARCFKH